ncbi:MAG: hypothetical protein ACTSW1_18940, partial [Candidatus Hodarchaeales archaeon]
MTYQPSNVNLKKITNHRHKVKIVSTLILALALFATIISNFHPKIVRANNPVSLSTTNVDYALVGQNLKKIIKTSDETLHTFYTGDTTSCPNKISDSGLMWMMSTDGVNWNCQAQLSNSLKDATSVTKDSDDNLYIVYSVNPLYIDQNSVYYRKLTKESGQSWTLGDQQTVLQTTLINNNLNSAVIENENDSRLWMAVRRRSTASINSIGWNGSYFLIGGEKGGLLKYDGTNWTNLSTAAGFDHSAQIGAIAYNSTDNYWLIGGGDLDDNDFEKLVKYDGTTFTDLTNSMIDFTYPIQSIAYNSTDNYFLIGGGESDQSADNNRLNKYDGTTFTDLSGSLIGWETFPILSIAYNSTDNYFLIGGGDSDSSNSNNPRINKYDGTTFTDLRVNLSNYTLYAIQSIAYNSTDNYFLIGGGDDDVNQNTKRLNKYDGTTFTDLSGSLINQQINITSMAWGSSFFLIGAGQLTEGIANYGLNKYDGTTFTDLKNLIEPYFGDGNGWRVDSYYSSDLSTAPAWTFSKQLSGTTFSATAAPAIFRFNNNKIGVLYNNNQGFPTSLVWHYRNDADNESTWTSEALVGSINCNSGFMHSVVGTTDGKIFATCYDSTEGIVFSNYNGSEWTSISGLDSSFATYAGIKVATDGTNVWIIYIDDDGVVDGVDDIGKLSYIKGVPPYTLSDFDSTPTPLITEDDFMNQVWVYDSSSGLYIDETIDAESVDTGDITLVEEVGDLIYFGADNKYRTVNMTGSVNGSGGTVVWEYWDGDSWELITIVGSDNPNFTSCTSSSVCGITFNSPSDWAKIQINTDSSPGYYYTRARVTTNYSTIPVGTQFRGMPNFEYIAFIDQVTNALEGIWLENIDGAWPHNVMYLSQTLNSSPNNPTSLGSSDLVDGSWSQDTTPQLSFTLSDPDNTDQVKFQIQIDDSSDFSSAVVDYTSVFAGEGERSFTVGQTAGSGSYTTGNEDQILSEGSYYWRVRAIDDDSAVSDYTTANSGEVAFKIDLTSPSTVSSLASSSHTLSTWSADTIVNLSWTGATDTSGSGVDGYSYIWNTTADTDPDTTKDIEENTVSLSSSTLDDGSSHYFHVRAVDQTANWGETSHLGPFYIDNTAPTVPGTPSTTNPTLNTTPTWTWTASTDTGTGLATNSYTVTWCENESFT